MPTCLMPSMISHNDRDGKPVMKGCGISPPKLQQRSYSRNQSPAGSNQTRKKRTQSLAILAPYPSHTWPVRATAPVRRIVRGQAARHREKGFNLPGDTGVCDVEAQQVLPWQTAAWTAADCSMKCFWVATVWAPDASVCCACNFTLLQLLGATHAVSQ